MSEFFKAALKCDPHAVNKTPLNFFIDSEGVMKELYHHQSLVAETLKTERLLRELEEEAQQRARAEAQSGIGEAPPAYHPPPQATGSLPPEQRVPGARALEERLLKSVEQNRQRYTALQRAVAEREGEECREAQKAVEQRQAEQERLQNAALVARLMEAREGAMATGVASVCYNDNSKLRAAQPTQHYNYQTIQLDGRSPEEVLAIGRPAPPGGANAPPGPNRSALSNRSAALQKSTTSLTVAEALEPRADRQAPHPIDIIQHNVATMLLNDLTAGADIIDESMAQMAQLAEQGRRQKGISLDTASSNGSQRATGAPPTTAEGASPIQLLYEAEQLRLIKEKRVPHTYVPPPF